MKKLVMLLSILMSFQVEAQSEDFYLKEKDDPAVLNAFLKAKEHRKIFLNALEDRGDGTSKYDYFGAYLRFEEQGQVEYLWLADVQQYKDFYIGVIVSDPRLLSNTKRGKTIGFYESDIYDWQLAEKLSGKTIGAFLTCANSDKKYLDAKGYACSL